MKRTHGDLAEALGDFRRARWDLGDEILVDRERYFSPEVASLEWERLWCRTWTIAGRVSDVPRVGDHFTYDLGRESFVVVRSTASEVRAFYNVCAHRGSRLVHRELGSVSRFVCSFHGWAWRVNGSLARITDEETFPARSICDRPALVEVRCETWGGFVFLTMDDAAPPLASFLGSLSEALGRYDLEGMSVVKDATYEWPVNWKIGIDAFLEGYHAHARHPELIRMIDDFHEDFEAYGNGHSRMRIPFGTKSPRIADRTSLTPELRASIASVGLDPADFEGRLAEVRPAMIEARKRWLERFAIPCGALDDDELLDDGNYGIFPNVTLNAHPEGVLMMRFRPHVSDPGRCHYDFWVLAHRRDDPSFALPFYMAVDPGTDLGRNGARPERRHGKHGDEGLGLVVEQDATFLPLVQQGVQSRGFRGARLGHQEMRVRYFHETWASWMATERTAVTAQRTG